MLLIYEKIASRIHKTKTELAMKIIVTGKTNLFYT